MSWDSYIDNCIAQSKDQNGSAHCDKAAIIGLATGASWTTAGHGHAIKPKEGEGETIAKCFKSKDFNPLMTGGIYLEGIKYQFLRVEEQGKLVLGKKKDYGAVTFQASKTAIVIGHTAEGGQQGCVNKGVAVIAEYLESLNM